MNILQYFIDCDAKPPDVVIKINGRMYPVSYKNYIIPVSFPCLLHPLGILTYALVLFVNVSLAFQAGNEGTCYMTFLTAGSTALSGHQFVFGTPFLRSVCHVSRYCQIDHHRSPPVAVLLTPMCRYLTSVGNESALCDRRHRLSR